MRYGLYSQGVTLFHKLHPLTKLLCAWLLLVAPLVVVDLKGACTTLALCMILITLARAWGSIRTLLPIVAMMAIVTTVVWPLFHRGGEELFTLFGLSISEAGAARGATMACRLVSLVMIGVAFLTVTRIEEFTASLRILGLPFVVTFALTLSFRLAPTFLLTVGTIRDAQRARGHAIDRGNPIRRALKHIPLIIPVLLHALRATDVLSMALESRAFGRKVTRTSILRLNSTWRDPVAYAVAGLALASAIIWRLCCH
ncbi:energy-coupling factor transporter transmembrane protein EcfT [bacterium]|nr:energy-coupling factor transporter transmembrane protein EcfT [bacterium]